MEINIWDLINRIIVIIGLPSLLVACVKIGEKLKTLNGLENEFKPDTKKFITKTNKEISNFGRSLSRLIERVRNMGEKVNEIWKNSFSTANSPRKLNSRGENILKTSGVKEIIDSKKDYFLNIVKKKNPKNSYDAERIIIDIVSDVMISDQKILEKIKEGAFGSGADIMAVLFVGGLYLRDKIFPDLGFSIDDIDRDEQTNNSNK